MFCFIQHRIKKSEDERRRRGNKFTQRLNSKLNGEYGSNFSKLHEELCSLRQEMKEEIDTLKSNIKGVEKSVDEI